MRGACKLLAALAALMGAAGVVLSALAAHQAHAESLAPAATLLLLHALAVIGAVLLAEQTLAQRHLGLLAAAGFVLGAALFSGTIALRQFTGHSFFPMAAPTGGTILIASWLALAIAAAWPQRAAD
ncbi:membrane protein [Afipia sp. P52-10]|jgi:uncharacterized membrane protein YgdD (TMEM256/DUF423 family)|uniref:DUF423 domain-containing protein n=1 Tax=Afipia sp. P52-10 TaxID=1429916 RepID=UPI0003DF43DB|nr:DUF423 domain-containing protein [Afipia sp. P52-10]ETR78267.1 membrane protein [Afipia sp. P52-10]